MFKWRDKLEIGNVVICLVKVHMVYLHTNRQFPIMPFPNKAMLKAKPSIAVFTKSKITLGCFFVFFAHLLTTFFINYGFCVLYTKASINANT